MNIADLRAKIRDIRDFPTEGILFKDITTLLKDGPADRAARGPHRRRGVPDRARLPPRPREAQELPAPFPHRLRLRRHHRWESRHGSLSCAVAPRSWPAPS